MTFTAIDIGAQVVSVIVTMIFMARMYNKAVSEGCYQGNEAVFIEIFVVISFNGVLLVIQGLAVFALSI